MDESMNVKLRRLENYVHFNDIRPKVEDVDKMQLLRDFLNENNITLMHGKSHIKIYSGVEVKNTIAQAFIL